MIKPLLAVAALAMLPAAEWPVETIASYPSGTFLENLDVTPDGALIVTSYFARELLVRRDREVPARFAALPAHPVGILAEADGFIVSAHGIPFSQGAAFTTSNQILLLDRAGAVKRTIPVADARFLNGLVRIGPDRVLIADSIAGTIWQLTPSSGAVTPWLAHPLLTQDAAGGGRPGANGLKLHRGTLYISNSSRGAIYRVAIADGAAAAAPVEAFRAGPVDDFAFAPDGAILAATHGATLKRIAPDGTVTDVMARGCDGCTSAAFHRGRLIVLTTGSLFEGGREPARILSLTPQ